MSLKSKHSELERSSAQLKRDLESVEPLKLENRKLSGELIEQRKFVDKLQTQLQEATWSEIGLQKQKDETQMKQIQVSSSLKTLMHFRILSYQHSLLTTTT